VFGSFSLNNRANTTSREDKWIGAVPLKQQFPTLYRVARHKHDSVASVFSKVPLNIFFRRYLLGDNLAHCHNQVSTFAHVRLNDRNACLDRVLLRMACSR
jgi:hypothetical protein